MKVKLHFPACKRNEGFSPKTVAIGDAVWSAENLAIDDGGEGISYNEESGEYYYTWAAAVRVAKSIPGWHLPTALEWNAAARACGAEEIVDSRGPNLNNYRGVSKLKRALDVKLAGYRHWGDYYDVGSYARFWTSTEYSAPGAYDRDFNTGVSMYADLNNKAHNYYSVRLVKD